MSIFDELKEKIVGQEKVIVFPEGEDERVLKAAVKLKNEGIIQPLVLGDETQIKQTAKTHELDLTGLKIINPKNDIRKDDFAKQYFELRKGKESEEQAKKQILDSNYFANMLVYNSLADGCVSGAAHSTADTVRPALKIIKTQAGMKRVSGQFIMEKDQQRYIFSDCAMNIDPDADTLVEIAYQAAQTAKMVGLEPKLAFLSFSTMGSAKGEMVSKVQAATASFEEKYPEISADGEMQFDAAFVASVGAKKAPNSNVAGHANVFIFPELQSGNIGYKIAQRLGDFTAIGPILAGLAKPVNDLSRGCSSQDVYEAAILTAAQSLDVE